MSAAHFTEISVQARYRELPRLMKAIAAWAQSAKIAPERVPRLQLLTEELFVNTIDHGYGGECDGEIRIDLQIAADELILRYCDRAPPFDTRQACPICPVERPGGRGLNLLQQLCKSLRYCHQNGRNQTELRIALNP